MTDTTDHPSRRAGLRDEIADALEAADYRMDMRRGDLADAIMPVLYREWPWLRAEAEAAAAVSVSAADRAAVLREAVRRIEDGEPLPDRDLRFRRGADWVLDALRRQAAEAAAGPAAGAAADTTPSETQPAARPEPDGEPYADDERPCLACGHTMDSHIRINGEIACVFHDCTDPTPDPARQPGNDTPVVAYRSHSGSLLRCLTHAPDQTGLDSGAFHPVTADDLPGGGVCTYRAPGVECGVDVLIPQQPKD